MRGWNQRKFFPKRICPECKKPFSPSHVKEVRCSDKCKKIALRRTATEYALNRKAKIADGTYESTWNFNDNQERGTVYGWRKYFAANPEGLKFIYPKTNLAGAVQDMRARGAL
jgi:endogenous inhibitor of DNA gyrase (YacG/DUF329 family)